MSGWQERSAFDNGRAAAFTSGAGAAEAAPARPEEDREHEPYGTDHHQDTVVLTAQTMIAPAAIIRRLTAVPIKRLPQWWFPALPTAGVALPGLEIASAS
jgi:hypothetical protein